jgi:hypothetical protein
MNSSALLATVLVLTVFAAASKAADAPAFSSAAPGNIFTDTTGVLSLRLPANSAGGEITLGDETGGVRQTLSVPADAAEAFTVTLPGKGYYTLAASVKLADGSVAKASTTAAVVGPVPSDEIRMQSRLGLWTVQGDPGLVLAAGARWNRRMISIHTLQENMLDPVPPPPEKLLFAQTPFSQVGVMSFGLPRWIMEPTDKKKSFGNPLTKPTDWAKLRQLVAAWTRQQSEHFPYHFEIYNEPEWQWSGGTNAELVRVLATIADGIKEARPQTKVLGPGFSSIRIKDPARLDLVTANELGLFDHLDGLVVHAYVDGTAPENEFIRRVAELKQFLADIGRPGYPVHITEFGWTSGKGTWQKPVDELTQARYAVRSLTLLAALGVENATYFALHYKAAPNDGERGFSLLRDDSTPKPSYAAYANVARWLANVKGLGTWLRLTPTTHLVLFEKTDDTSVAVAWDTASGRVIGLPLATSRREDMTGRALPATDDLALSPSPIFLEFSRAQSPSIDMLPALDVMRGGDDVTLARGRDWIAPAPLRVRDGKLSVPAAAANGDYLLLARDGDRWLGQPVRVIPPLEASAPVLEWPAGQPAPRLATTVVSYAGAPVTTRLAVTLDGARDRFLNPPVVQPGETRRLTLPLDGLMTGRRYRGKLAVDSRHEGRRDEITRPLDLTVLAAAPVPRGGAPDWEKIPAVDFSEWDPFGGPITRGDCSATMQAAHGADGLHLRVVVRDDEHLQTQTGEHIWSHDAIQVGLDPDHQKTWEANDLFGLKGHRVFEYGVAGASDDKAVVLRPMTWRWISYTDTLPVGVPEPRIRLKVTREGDLTTYDILFPWAVMGLDRPMPAGSAVGIALSLADADTGKKGRRALRLFNGVSEGKDPEKFGPLWLR